MSSKKKNRNQKKQTKKQTKVSHAPIPVTQKKVVPLDVILERVYTKEDLSTTCLRQCTCCRVACPQMKFSEASNIIDVIWSTWSKEDKKRILVEAVKYYFSDSLIKPCLLLKGNVCQIYKHRPLNCRLYGLWPSDSWEERVAMFSKSTGLPREKLPLNIQCPHVRRKPQTCPDCEGTGSTTVAGSSEESMNLGLCKKCGGSGKIQSASLTSEQISELFNLLDQVDKTIGVSELKIATSWNYRTFHDWILLKFWGESTLSKWTNLILTTTHEQRQGIIDAFESQIDKIDIV